MLFLLWRKQGYVIYEFAAVAVMSLRPTVIVISPYEKTVRTVPDVGQFFFYRFMSDDNARQFLQQGILVCNSQWPYHSAGSIYNLYAQRVFLVVEEGDSL